uniref:UBC core domain-containing protein n=1 Tax=Romanomermis culicivorax TaxID=13658 RepID=A0A915IFL7_ROMCU
MLVLSGSDMKFQSLLIPSKFFQPFHPNIEPNGRMCFPTINPATWRANTRIRDVLLELDEMLTKPDPEHALRADAGKLFMEDKNGYEKRVADSIKEVGDPRLQPLQV